MLAGVVTLSGAAASFTAALAVGVAYVFGMVGPLFAIALAWERYDWGNSALLRGRSWTVRLFGRTRTLQSTALLSGVLLVVMGVLVLLLAFTGTAMEPDGWQARLSAELRHYADVALGWLDVIPGWVALAGVVAAVGLLARRAMGQYLDEQDERAGTADPEEPAHGLLVGSAGTETEP